MLQGASGAAADRAHQRTGYAGTEADGAGTAATAPPLGTAILLVTHDLGLVSAMADTVLVLQDGRSVEYGPVRQVLQTPRTDYVRELLDAVPETPEELKWKQSWRSGI